MRLRRRLEEPIRRRNPLFPQQSQKIRISGPIPAQDIGARSQRGVDRAPVQQDVLPHDEPCVLAAQKRAGGAEFFRRAVAPRRNGGRPLRARLVHTNLREMRAQEGRVMLQDLEQNCDAIVDASHEIQKLAPRVVENYSKKLTDRINQMLKAYEVSISPSDVVREVGMFAERVDISEEIVRLGSHIKQFREVMSSAESNGRKLDFLTQELLRETNTIGSKANDSEIAARVVEIKTCIERIREMVQNVE